jgi:hypothetical protein
LQGFWFSPIKPRFWLKKEQSLARNEKSGCHLCGLQVLDPFDRCPKEVRARINGNPFTKTILPVYP